MIVSVLGLGLSGKSVINYCLNRFHTIFIWDDYVKERYSYGKNVVYRNFYSEGFGGSSFFVVSPGIDPMHSLIAKAHHENIKIISDMDLFFYDLNNRNINVSTYVIVGTNGKSTTTHILTFLLQHYNDFSNVHMLGNIGIPVLELIDNIKSHDMIVIEMSSYNIDHIHSQIHINYLFWLNFSIDHIDRYKTCEQYFLSKSRILSLLKKKSNFPIVYLADTDDYSLRIVGIAKYFKLSYTYITISDYLSFFYTCDINRLSCLFGKYALYNIVLLCAFMKKEYSCSYKDTVNILYKYQPLPYRAQCIYNSHGICVINDSKSTNFMSSVNTLSRFSRIIWIVGGKIKTHESSTIHVFSSILSHLMSVYTYGSSRNVFMQYFSSYNISVTSILSFTQCIELALERSLSITRPPGIYVVFSPGCDSFESHRNFQERGNNFSFLACNFFKMREL